MTADTLTPHALDVLAIGLPLTEWAAGRDQAMPARAWRNRLRKVWPHRYVEAELPAAGHTSGAGRPGTVRQPVLVVPLSWLRALAARAGVPIASAIEAVIT